MGLPAPYGVASTRRPAALATDPANAVITGQFAAVGPGKYFAFKGPANLAIWGQKVTTLTTTNGSLAASVGDGTGMAAGTAVNSVNVPLGTTWATFTGTTGTLALPSMDVQGDVTIGINQIRGLRITPAWFVGASVVGDGIPSGTTITGIVNQAVAATNNTPAVLGAVTISNPATATSPLFKNAPLFFTAQATSGAIVTGADANAVFTGAGITFTGTIQLERSFDGCATAIVCNIGGSGTLAQFSAGTPVSTSILESEGDVYYRLNCTAYTAVSGVTINYRLSETGMAATSLSLGSAI